MRVRNLAETLLLLLSVIVTPAHAASYDCARAAMPDERAVCADARLSEIDELVSRAFANAKRAAPGDQRQIVTFARGFLKDRQRCGTDRSCILSHYLDALIAYQNFGAEDSIPSWATAALIAGDRVPSATGSPTLIGQCAMVEIAEITPRLDSGRRPTEQDYESGTAVTFRNGLHQVSYEREAALLSSRPGDKTILCLVSIPFGCPPGDNRGRYYAATNVRTRGSWILPDSQHRCGGA